MSEYILEYTREEIVEAIGKSSSTKEVLKNLGVTGQLGSRLYKAFLDRVNSLELKLPKTKTKFIKRIELVDILVENSSYSRTNLKKRLVEENLLQNRCYTCGITEWNNKKIQFQIDHKNGINNDNRLENLRFLCPNCHSQTENYCGKNIQKEKVKNLCHKCKKVISSSSIFCRKCVPKSRKVERPNFEDLKKMIWETPTVEIAKAYNVSDKAVEKWIKSYGLEKPGRGYWTKQKKIAKSNG